MIISYLSFVGIEFAGAKLEINWNMKNKTEKNFSSLMFINFSTMANRHSYFKDLSISFTRSSSIFLRRISFAGLKASS